MEYLLHYVWKHRLYTSSPLLTTGGERVEVIDVGQHNRDSGPDFFNAKVRIEGVLWAGNVEIHDHESEWYDHRHDEDSKYDNTVLHVVASLHTPTEERKFRFPVVTKAAKTVPTVLLTIPPMVADNYRRLLETEEYPRCHDILPTMPAIKVHSWLSALLAERLEERAALVTRRAETFGGDWERAFFVTLSRNFGFGKNGDAFEQWAKRLPLSSIVHHRDNIFQVEAMFLGIAGLLDTGPASHASEAATDSHRIELQREFQYLCKKFRIDLSAHEPVQWRFMRMRPQSFPHIRLVQLANFYVSGAISLSAVLDRSTDIRSLERLLDTAVSPYWQTHYTFGCDSARSSKSLTLSSRHLIIINTIVPVLWAYAAHQRRPELRDRAIALLEQIKCEQNYITRQWRACGVTVDTAADSQALIQLKLTRCDRYDCLRCRFAYEYLKKSTSSPSL